MKRTENSSRAPERDDVIAIDVTNRQTALPLDEPRLRQAVRMILQDASIPEAQIGVAVVDDATIHELNRRYLEHDEATDVLSFVLERSERYLEGEVVVCADVAREAAPRFGWSAQDELLLYVIHGTLHLLGCDDAEPTDRAEMRGRERTYLSRFGLEPQYEESDRENHAPGRQRPAGSSSGVDKIP